MRTFVLPVLFLFLIPTISLVVFEAGEAKYDGMARSGIEQANAIVRLDEGRISGMLPRSRMTHWVGTGRAAEPVRAAHHPGPHPVGHLDVVVLRDPDPGGRCRRRGRRLGRGRRRRGQERPGQGERERARFHRVLRGPRLRSCGCH